MTKYYSIKSMSVNLLNTDPFNRSTDLDWIKSITLKVIPYSGVTYSGGALVSEKGTEITVELPVKNGQYVERDTLHDQLPELEHSEFEYFQLCIQKHCPLLEWIL